MTTAKKQFTMSSDSFSPASLCIYSFEFPTPSNLGDIIAVEVEGLSRVDLYFARGVNELIARGRLVRDPKAALIKSRFPDVIYLTLLNKDIE